MDIEQLPFDTKDIVYAKIENYPWWPGKIIQIVQHKSSIFFKVSFFADPTYCFLKQSNLIAFKNFNSSLNKGFIISSQLQKAIQLANNAFQRKKNILQKQFLKNIQEKVAQKINETNLQEKNQDNSLKIDDLDQSTMIYVKQCNNQNSQNSEEQKIQKINQLLQKYMLNNIPKLQKQFENQSVINEQLENQQVHFINKKHKIKKQQHKISKHFVKKINKLIKFSNQHNKIKYIKKINKILIQKGVQAQKSRQLSIKFLQKIQISSKNQSIKFQNKMKIVQNIILTKQIQKLDDLIDSYQYQSINPIKIEDQEKSKLTQLTKVLTQEIQIL